MRIPEVSIFFPCAFLSSFSSLPSTPNLSIPSCHSTPGSSHLCLINDTDNDPDYSQGWNIWGFRCLNAYMSEIPAPAAVSFSSKFCIIGAHALSVCWLLIPLMPEPLWVLRSVIHSLTSLLLTADDLVPVSPEALIPWREAQLTLTKTLPGGHKI